jgi:hypothetical protein
MHKSRKLPTRVLFTDKIVWDSLIMAMEPTE